MADDAGDVGDGGCQFFGVADMVGFWAKNGVEQGVGVVGEKELAIGRQAGRSLAAKGLQAPNNDGQSESHHFDENRKFVAEAGHEFFVSDDNNKSSADGGYDFFAKQVSAAAFEQIEIRGYFISAVYGNVNGAYGFERAEGDAQFACEFFGGV